MSTIIILTPPPPPPPPDDSDGPLGLLAPHRRATDRSCCDHGHVEVLGDPLTAESMGLLVRSLAAQYGAGAVRDAARGDSGADED